MRLARFGVDEHVKFGIIIGGQLADVSDEVSEAGGLRSMIASGAIATVEAAAESAERYAVADGARINLLASGDFFRSVQTQPDAAQ